MATAPSLTSALRSQVLQAIAGRGGWMAFDRYMEQVLYAPGMGYYARGNAIFGSMPPGAEGGGSDFVTAPELSPYFGRALAAQIGEALQRTGTEEVWEFGAGSGALAQQLLAALGERVRRYTIVDLSGALRQHQAARLADFGARVRWADAWPSALEGVVMGNEVLDAMPVKLLLRRQGVWHERGVVAGPDGGLAWGDMPTATRPPAEIAGEHDYLTEIHPAAQAFMRSLADRMQRGAAFFIDYGFPEREYYHAQRAMGTVMCHRAHRMDTDPLADPGSKDITAHVDFTGLALAAQEAADAQPHAAPWSLLGYTTQARFLINCGLPAMMEGAGPQDRAAAQKLLMEHEMGELFKVIAFCRGPAWDALGFTQGDRSHTL